MIRFCRILTVTTLVLFMCFGIVSGQTGFRPKNEFGEARFAIDAVDFRGKHEGLHTLEVYYKIFYNALSYQKVSDGYLAQYEIAFIIEDGDDDQIEGVIREGEIKVKTFNETRRDKDFVINLISVEVDEQDINIRAILTDKLANTSREIKKSLKKREYWHKYPTLSRVEFSREISESTKESKFNKGNLRVIPSVTRVFGGDSDSMLIYYQEIYPGENDVKNIKVVTRIYGRTKGFIYSDTVDYGEIDEVKHAVNRINVTNMRPGDYELEVRVEGRRGKLYKKEVEEFELELTGEAIFKNDYETAVEMLKYLATREEHKKLKKAKSDEERRRAWDEFWALRANSPYDRENPTKIEYFRRVRHANRYFSFMKKEGWKTTRGMIYITYGEPDEVDDHPFELSTKPYQIWLYYRLTPPRKFLFIDEWGDGNYELQPPYNGLNW